MKSRFVFLVCCLLHILSGFAEARLPKTVPLLPPRESGTANSSLKNRNNHVRLSQQEPVSIGFELGALLRNDATSSDLLGMQLFWGGRASTEISLVKSQLYIKPSIGYFRKQQSEGSVSVVQHVFEGGANVLYQVTQSPFMNWSLGVAGRLDYLISSLKVYNQSESGSSFRFRAGPSSSLKFNVSQGVKFATDVEFTFAVSRPTRFFGGLTSGLVFDL